MAARLEALRQAASSPDADLRALLDAAFIELDGAIEAAESADGQDDSPAQAPQGSLPDPYRAERRLLRAAFSQAPVPLFLLEPDGIVRRASTMAGQLIGSSPGYATGKPLTAFIDLPTRAAVQTKLAAAARKGEPCQVECRVLTAGGPADAVLSAEVIALPGDPRLLVVTVSTSGVPASAGSAEHAPDQAIEMMTRRLDLVTAVTRALLDNSTFSEAVTLQRCARLLAGQLASWVVIDVERGGRLRRQVVAGPRDADPAARALRGSEPLADTMPARVHADRRPVLAAHAQDTGALGTDSGGAPLLMLLGGTSLLSVPIADDSRCYGVLTLVRQAAERPFEIADLGLAEELGRHLAIAMRVDRVFRRRSEVAETLQASLLPSRLPAAQGLDFSTAYIAASEWQEISGDFYDVFPVGDGWGVAVGDVCGKGEEAAAMTAAARHAIRALAHNDPDPAEVLAKVNEVLVAGGYEERFVTARLGFLRVENDQVLVTLGGSGHPGPAVVRSDGRVELLSGDGLPLGMFAGAKPSTDEVVLSAGDLLFFYTDGVTQARGKDASLFEDQLADALAGLAGQSAAQVVRAITELVTEFSGAELRDDVTILAVKAVRAR